MSIYKKLFEAKKEIGKISKDSTNPFYKSKYFDINKLLEHVEPILQDNGLLILQPIIEGSVVSQIIDPETSEMIESSIEIKQVDAQKKGIEITYYRRYTLASMLGLQAEDNDGNMQVSKPKLDDKGLEFLISRGTVEHINDAFKLRSVSNSQKTLLNNRLEELKK